MSGQVLLYVDGACKGNPGPGGWAAVLRCGDHTKELVGGADHTTNNRMELQAVIEGLKALKKRSVVKLVTDSQYVIHMLNGARAKANQDLVEELRQLAGQHQVQAQWVKGHNGHASNSTNSLTNWRAAKPPTGNKWLRPVGETKQSPRRRGWSCLSGGWWVRFCPRWRSWVVRGSGWGLVWWVLMGKRCCIPTTIPQAKTNMLPGLKPSTNCMNANG